MKIESQRPEQVKFWNAIYEATTNQSGVAVPYEVAKGVAEAMGTYSAMRRACTVITTARGGPMGWGSSDGRSEIGEQVDQNQSTSSLDPSFGLVGLPVFRFSSKLIKVPIELFQDNGIDFTTFLDHRIAARIGRITNKKLTLGSSRVLAPGTLPLGVDATEPTGILPAAQLGKIGAAGQFMTLVYDDLEDLVYSVDELYRQSPKCAWMMHEQTLRFIKKMKDDNGYPLRLVSRGSDLQERLLDYPVFINNDMPVMAAGVKSVLFGDFGTYIIRDALNTEVHKMTDSALVLSGQIGFVGFARCGGAPVDQGGAIKAYQNSAS